MKNRGGEFEAVGIEFSDNEANWQGGSGPHWKGGACCKRGSGPPQKADRTRCLTLWVSGGWVRKEQTALGGNRCFFAKTPGAENAKHDEQQQRDQLSDLKGRFRLRGRQGFQCGHFQERLDDQNKDVEVQSEHRGDDIGATPSAVEPAGVAGKNRQSQNNQRNESHDVGRKKVLNREEVTGRTGSNGSDQKHGGPTVEALGTDQTENDNEAGEDTDQTESDMKQSESRQTGTQERTSCW